jgi:hypothetical protein
LSYVVLCRTTKYSDLFKFREVGYVYFVDFINHLKNKLLLLLWSTELDRVSQLGPLYFENNDELNCYFCMMSSQFSHNKNIKILSPVVLKN